MALRLLFVGRVRAKLASLISDSPLLLSPTTKTKINKNNNHNHICNHRRQCHSAGSDDKILSICREFEENAMEFFSCSDDEDNVRIVPLSGYEEKDYVVDSARLAINIHNQRNENSQLQFVRVLKVDYVAHDGMQLHIILEVSDAGEPALCDTIVHCRPWDGSKEVIQPLVLRML